MSTPLTRNLLVVGAVVLSVLLFFAPRLPEPAASTPAAQRSHNASIESYVAKAMESLSEADKARVEVWKKMPGNDSLINGWVRLKRIDVSAFYAEKQAAAVNTVPLWVEAGNRY